MRSASSLYVSPQMAFLSLLMMAGLMSCHNRSEEARSYYSAVYESTDSMLYGIHRFEDAVTARSEEDPKISLNALRQQLAHCRALIEKSGSYGKDDTMQKAATDLIAYYEMHCRGDFDRMAHLDFRKLPPNDCDKVYAAWDEFYDKEWPLFQRFDIARTRFANRYNIFDIQMKEISRQ